MAVVELVPRIDKREAMLEILRFVEERTRMKPECLECGVFESADERQQVLYLEQWQSTDGLQAHIKSDLYLWILNAMELACEEPRISFHQVSQTKSMGLIEKLRS